MKLTVIIALYNTEEYIARCIQSVLDSDLRKDEYEIIVINDGSTDKGAKIVESLMINNGNLRLINKPNGGQSSARNLGINHSKGDYIFCLDSDDYVDSNLFSKALDVAVKNDLDLYPIKFIKVSENGEELKVKDTYRTFNRTMNGPEFLKEFTISGAMARYFYKSKIIKENNLKLLEGIYHEDEEFVTRFLTYVSRVKYDGLPVYFYLIRSSSTMNNKNIKHREKLIKDLIKVVDSLSNLILENCKNEGIVVGVGRKKQQILLSIMLKLRNSHFSNHFKKEMYNELKVKNYYPLKLNNLSVKQKIVGILFNWNLL
ncbi:glycosyltransferase family 2 protein [Sphingobacterium endophyticum]|uniref:glycosyltransferase family 2 protein n=1 Tax=Sphingobacterium endophyticum TaxID=2546448 RepID=UPI0018CE6049|nr:glycosyltransferase [Sphingobacterium endophyticum]